MTVSFHPDRATRTGEPLLAALARDGRLRSQFATGTSNGGLTAHPGRDRWRWESRLFGAAYDDASPEERPVYGALQVRPPQVGALQVGALQVRPPQVGTAGGGLPEVPAATGCVGGCRGASPRFGSAFLRLRPGVLERTTCCYPDSHLDPVDVGTAATAGRLLVLAGLCGPEVGVDALGRPLGRTTGEPGPPPGVTRPSGATRPSGVTRPSGAMEPPELSDPLDRYVEAQVHGPVLLTDDVEALVLDPAFRGTGVERLARELPCPLEWHPGWELDLAVLRSEGPAYRGAEVVAAGEALAVAGILDARAVGAGVDSGVDPQTLKRLWHCVARFGAAGSGTRPS